MCTHGLHPYRYASKEFFAIKKEWTPLQQLNFRWKVLLDHRICKQQENCALACLFLFLLLVFAAAASAHDTHRESLVTTCTSFHCSFSTPLFPAPRTESNKLESDYSERAAAFYPLSFLGLILTRNIGKEININHCQVGSNGMKITGCSNCMETPLTYVYPHVTALYKAKFS